MSDKTLKILYKEPNRKAKEMTVRDDYQTISHLCKGMIDLVKYPLSDHIILFVNDSFLVDNMPPTLILPETGQLICGPVLFTGYDPKTGESLSLTKTQMKEVRNYLAQNEIYHMTLESAYRYLQALGPIKSRKAFLTENEDPLGIDKGGDHA